MYEICLNHFIFSSHGLSVVSIDYKCLHIIIQIWFGGSIFVSGPQGAGAALCVSHSEQNLTKCVKLKPS